MPHKKFLLFVVLGSLLFASVALYSIGLRGASPENGSANPLPKEIATTSGDIIPPQPVIVPAEDLNIVPTPKEKPCVISGCSGEICAEEEVASICLWKEEYACYKTARCERQSSGKCGWTETAELRMCLQDSLPQPL